MHLPYGVSDSTQPWLANPHKPISWWDVRQFQGPMFVWAGYALEELWHECALASGPGDVPLFNTSQPVEERMKTKAIERLNPVEFTFRSVGLVVTADTIKELIEELEAELEKPGVLKNYQWLMDQIVNIKKLLGKEMKNTLFFYIPSERMRFLPKAESPYIFGAEVSKAFPSCKFDSEEAAACLACGRATAGVFHLMRVLEIGLGALGKVFGVSLEHTNWAPAIEEIESKIRNMHKEPSRKVLPDCKELQSFYSKAAASFGVMKDAWRNHTMHVRAKYTEEEAGQIFDAVKGFMQKLAERLTE